MSRVLTHLLRLKGCCLDVLHSRFVRWTKPLTPSLLIGSLADLGRSKSQLLAENALLRKPLIILNRQVKRCCHRIWWIIRSAPVNAFRADFPFIQPSREVASSCSSPPPSALSFTVPPLPFRGAPSRFRGSQKAEHGTGGRGEQRTSPAVHRRFVFPAAIAGVRCR
jgi:hypothetical protein